MADLITVAQVEARMRRTFTGAWVAQVEANIEDASGLVREAADGHLDDKDHTTVPVSARRVVYEMVRRAIDNPNALVEEGTDSVYRWKVAEGNDTIYLTDQEEQIVRDAVGLHGIGQLDLTTDMPLRLLQEADMEGPGFTLAHDFD